MTWIVRDAETDEPKYAFETKREARDWINKRTMPWNFYVEEEQPPMRWLLAVALDGNPDPFILFKPSGEILLNEDGTTTRYPTDMDAMHAGLKLDVAATRARALLGEPEAQQDAAEHRGDGDRAERVTVEAHPHTVAENR